MLNCMTQAMPCHSQVASRYSYGRIKDLYHALVKLVSHNVPEDTRMSHLPRDAGVEGLQLVPRPPAALGLEALNCKGGGVAE